MDKKENEQNEDVVFESEEAETSFGSFEKKFKKVKEELKKCQEEKSEYLDGWQRSKADFINFKKRSEENLKEFRKYANEDLIVSVLPTLDNFEAALKDHGESEDIKRWKTGFEHIYNQFKKTLENVGLEEINPEGESFNPNIHESVELIETNNKKMDHKISEVVMKGYKVGEKILRAPQVKVWVVKE